MASRHPHCTYCDGIGEYKSYGITQDCPECRGTGLAAKGICSVCGGRIEFCYPSGTWLHEDAPEAFLVDTEVNHDGVPYSD